MVSRRSESRVAQVASFVYSEAVALARTEVDQDIEWPPDFVNQHFHALKAVGWSCALGGDLLGCFRYLRAAERTEASQAFEAMVLVDRSYFARIVGEHNWAANEVAKAKAIADRIDWNELAGDERVGLLLLAEAMAEYNTEKAHFYLARYKSLDRFARPSISSRSINAAGLSPTIAKASSS